MQRERKPDIELRRRGQFEALPLRDVYRLIEPGPVTLLTTAIRDHRNVMTLSWHMMVDFHPPLIGAVVSSGNHSFMALRATRQCVIAFPAVEMADTVVAVGNCSGRTVDKFATLGIETMPAETISPPLVAGCFANLECRAIDTRLVNRFNLFVLEATRAWIDPRRRDAKTIHHQGYGQFLVDGKTLTLPSAMP